jgi:class 3 adenylate cyclase/tetratricopeptide (TPR) repeat protein
MRQIAEWLDAIGLAKYQTVFADNEIDWSLLPKLTEADLKELGLPFGPRKKLLEAIASLSATPVAASSGKPREAERRQLTVVFCDLVGSTALSQGMDPEDLRAVIRSFQDAAAGAITRFEGHVAKFMGDAVLAYFGYPRAHEDDAERAVRAGIALVEAVRGLKHGERSALEVRVGIATGLAVVGDVVGEGGAREETAVGEMLNLAARLQQIATPGAVVVAPATRALLGQMFELESLGAKALKGLANLVEVWRVVGEQTVETRFEAVRSQRLNHLVGRDQELGLAQVRWEAAKAGEGQVVLLRAEPGLGKSRLVAEFRRLEAETVASVRYQCSPHHINSALYPVIQQLSRAARLEPGDPARTKLDKLAALVGQSNMEPKDAVPLLAAMLSIPANDAYPALQLSPEQQKAGTLTLLVDLLAGLAARGPVLVVVEDLHWADPTMRELFDLVVGRVERLPVIVLITFRPEIVTPWEGRGNVTLVTLNRLARRHVEELATEVAEGKTLPPEVLQQIAERTDGVPLFVEELTKSLLESGFLKEAGERWELTGRLPQMAVPTSLQASLASRLDRLAPVREVAQIGAALGREFDFDLLAAIAPYGENQLAEALAQLHEAELIFPRGAPPRTRWTFKHALIQDAAYDTLLKTSRAALHAKIAEALKARFPALVEAEPETMALHYREAGAFGEAIEFLQIAAQRAMARSAHIDAVAHLKAALGLVAELGEGTERLRTEMRLQFALGPALISMSGYSSEETSKAFERAADLSALIGDTSQLISIFWGRFVVNVSRANHRDATAVARNFGEQAEARGDPLAISMSHRCIGFECLLVGELDRAKAMLDSSISLFQEMHDPPSAWKLGQDFHVASLIYAAMTQWLRGYPDEARRLKNEALTRADMLNHPQTIGHVNSYALLVSGWLRDVGEPHAHARRMIEVADKYLLPLWSAHGAMGLGIDLIRGGNSKEGLEQLTAGEARFARMGWRLMLIEYLSYRVRALHQAGDTSAAFGVLAELFDAVEETNERYYEAELWRLHGTLSLARGGQKEAAETSFRKAVELAERQGSKSFQLRAACDLARLHAARGDRTEALAILEPTYSCFTEGLDTPDLKEGKALLDELS